MPLRYASAIDLVPLLNRLSPTPRRLRRRRHARRRRSSASRSSPIRARTAILLRAENPGRVARMRQLIEQLDTPGRPGGNMFIVYLKNADAARVAQTLRAMLTGNVEARRAVGHRAFASAGVIGCIGQRPTAASARPAAPPPSAPAPFTPSTQSAFAAGGATITAGHREQRAGHHGAGAGLQQPARDHREARRAARAGVRRGADLRGLGRQGGRVRHPVAGAVRLNTTQARVHRRHQLHAARQRQQHHRHRRQPRHRRRRASRSAS